MSNNRKQTNVTANAQGILFNEGLVTWDEVERLRNEALRINPLPEGKLIEFGSTFVTLKPNTTYITEHFNINMSCKSQVFANITGGSLSPLVVNPIEFAVNNTSDWMTDTYMCVAGDKVHLRFTTPFKGIATYFFIINDNIAGKINVDVKE